MISLVTIELLFYSQAGGIGHSKRNSPLLLWQRARRAKEKQGCKSRHEEPVSCSFSCFPIGVARRFPETVTFRLVTAVIIFCEIRIPIPGRGTRQLH